MQDSLIDQGINLMIYGMGTVFVFLTILVFSTNLMSKLVNKFAPEPTAQDTPGSAPAPIAAGQPQPQVLEAIKQAISQHRQA